MESEMAHISIKDKIKQHPQKILVDYKMISDLKLQVTLLRRENQALKMAHHSVLASINSAV
jgi:regulator of replication initiation timing